MLVKQMMWNEEEKWQDLDSTQVDNPQLVLFFASPKLMESSDQYDLIREKFPKADIIGCSSAGERFGTKALSSLPYSSIIHQFALLLYSFMRLTVLCRLASSSVPSC